jgi:uncharacterized protein
MKVVVDTNVFVSAHLSVKGPPNRIARMAIEGALTVCYDSRILYEYHSVLLRPRFGFAVDDVMPFVEAIRVSGELIAAHLLPESLPDPDDEMFLEVAVAAPAECLITGNLRHFPVSRRQGVTVLSPREFIEYYRSSTRK